MTHTLEHPKPEPAPPKDAPIQKFRARPLTASIWHNTHTKDGKPFTTYAIELERAYKDKTDQWQHTTRLRPDDLPKARYLLDQCYAYLMEHP